MLRALPLLVLLAVALPARASELPWLAGYWLDCDGKAVSETWVDSGSDTLAGIGLTRGRSRTSFEFMRIAKGTDGALAFFGSPNGAPAVSFPLTSAGPQTAVFENPQHDFPQRVIYRREGQTLHARIEGMMDGRPAGMDWTYKAAALNTVCPAAKP